jgi:biopolymer transport protein ExbB
VNIIQTLHNLSFYAMYAAAGIAVFVIIERQIFFSIANRDARHMLKAATSHERSALAISPAGEKRGSVAVRVAHEFNSARRAAPPGADHDDLAEAVYITHRETVIARLWLLDTVVTAAPLLGLVGTILGIIETFAVLASSGISDPAGVSRGIGTALYATALGISIALFGLLFYNYFSKCSEKLCDRLKVLLLRESTSHADAPPKSERLRQSETAGSASGPARHDDPTVPRSLRASNTAR